MTDHGPDECSTFEQRLRRAARLPFRERQRAEKRLAREASRHARDLARLAADDDVAVRRTAVEVSRREARRDPSVRRLLVSRLETEKDVKTRRRLSAALGDSGATEVCDALLARLEHEEHRFAQASLVLALGKLGFRDWPQRWRDLADRAGPVGEALRKALGRITTTPLPEAGRTPVERRPGRYVLRCYPGLEELVGLELARHSLRMSGPPADGRVEVEARDRSQLDALGRLRTVLEDFRVAGRVAAGEGQDDLGSLVTEGCRRILEELDGERDLAFRLALPPQAGRREARRRIRDLSRRIARQTGWTNNPSSYALLIRVDGHDRLLWRHRGWTAARDREPPRETVAASIHPTVAAALCRIVWEAVGPAAVLLDPCSGAATIPREWLAVAASPGRAFAFDRSPRAAAIGRSNLAFRGPRAAVAAADLGRIPLPDGSVDAVVANPPFGLRVRHPESNRRLYGRLLAEARRVLRPGGCVLLYTADAKALEAAAGDWRRAGSGDRGSGDRGSGRGVPGASSPPEVVARIGAGGLVFSVFRIRKSSSEIGSNSLDFEDHEPSTR